jgi:hypothetical protein
MAKVALIKLFTGMYMSLAQLLGELEKGGHTGHVFSFKQYKNVPEDQLDLFCIDEFPTFGYSISKSREVERSTWNAYKPIRERELQYLVAELKAFNPDVLAFSLQSSSIKSNGELVRLLREHFDVPIIWGGPGPSIEPERSLEFADLVCTNEGEEVIVDIADRIDSGLSFLDVPGTWVRLENGELFKNPTRPLRSLNEIVFPSWNLDRYTHIGMAGARKRPADIVLDGIYPIMTQRGCPFSCSFCIESRYQEMFGKKNSLRRRDPELVIEELVLAKETLPVSVVGFWDDVFTVNPRWHAQFLPQYKEKVGMPFWCYTYPTTHTRELLSDMKDAGLAAITMGVQHGSERVLREHFNRPTSRERVLEAIDEILDLGSVILKIDYLTKIPMETEQDLQEALDLLLQIPKEVILQGIGETTAFPTFGYTRKISQAVDDQLIPSVGSRLLGDDTYFFYLTLMLLTRSDMPMDQIRAISKDHSLRQHPDVLRKIVQEEGFAYDWRGSDRYEKNLELRLLFV